MPPRAVTNFTCSGCRRSITNGVYTSRYGEILCYNCLEDDDLAICSACGQVVECIDLVETLDGNQWCEECAFNTSSICDNCNLPFWSNERVVVQRIISDGRRPRSVAGDILCPDCGFDLAQWCVECDQPTYAYESIRTVAGDYVCQICYNLHYGRCTVCGEAELNCHLMLCSQGMCCEDCQEEYPGGGSNFPPGGFRNTSVHTAEIGSARCFGIELETDVCTNYTSLRGTPAWGVKDDCTVSGKEFYSDILSGDEGLAAIREWGKIAKRYKWRAGNSAGYHLHLDMRNESDDSLYAIAYAYRRTQEVWMSFVDCRRHTGTYSHEIRWSCIDIARAIQASHSFSSWARCNSRYNWCNLYAYRDHSTIEIRLYEGVCDDTEIINWVKAHIRFADWAAKLGYEGAKRALRGLDCNGMFALITKEVWKDSNLSTYYSEKAKSRNHGYLTGLCAV